MSLSRKNMGIILGYGRERERDWDTGKENRNHYLGFRV